jgi:putative ABC transport system ATP-binding protein
MPNICVRDLTMEYSSGGYAVRPFDHFDLDLATGDLALLLGASGCGKTTLLSMLAGILTPTSGSICVGDLEITRLKGASLAAYRRHTVGVVFQGFNLIPSLTAYENLYVAMRYAGTGRKAAKTRSEELLTMVGLEDRMHHRPGKLSGGQQQRVAIARALSLDPPLIVADEPTASLDYVQVDGVLRLLRELAAPGRVVVVATHDERLLPLADEIVELTPHRSEESRAPEHIELAPGEVLFRQGDPGDLVYEVDTGGIEIVQEMFDGTETLLGLIEPGKYFGELAPMFGLRRSATARAMRTEPTAVTGYTLRDFRTRRGNTTAPQHTARATDTTPPTISANAT